MTQIQRWLEIDSDQKQKQGKREKITDDSLEKLIEALQLPYSETILLYGLAGKIPPVRLPSEHQIKQSLETLIPALESFPYPAYVLDTRTFRFWIVNAATVVLIGGEDRLKKLAGCSVLELLFSSGLGMHDLLGDNLGRIQKNQVHRFKALNLFRQHEEHFMTYPEYLCDKASNPFALNEEDYKIFKDIWDATTIVQSPEDYIAAADITFKLEDERIEFHLIVEAVLDLGNTFSISWFNLWNHDYKSLADQMFEQARGKPCIKLWEVSSTSHFNLPS